MSYFEIILVLVVVGMGFWVWYLMHKKAKDKEMPELMRLQAEKKQEHKQKILELLCQKERIANDDVEGLLSVSDATATRYLDDLEKEGKIRQIGDRGGYVYYEKA